MEQKVVIIVFCSNLSYGLHPESISLLFADFSSTTPVKDCVPRQFTLSQTIVFVLSAMTDQRLR